MADRPWARFESKIPCGHKMGHCCESTRLISTPFFAGPKSVIFFLCLPVCDNFQFLLIVISIYSTELMLVMVLDFTKLMRVLLGNLQQK